MEGTRVRTVVVINLGNRAGCTLARRNMESLVRFSEWERLVIRADEVYQANVYVYEKSFASFKNVVAGDAATNRAGQVALEVEGIRRRVRVSKRAR